MNPKAQQLRDLFHKGQNPYENHDVSQYQSIYAPLSGDDIWPSIITDIKPRLIIEVGTFLGGSAISMGRALTTQNITESAILCVDSWLGDKQLLEHPELRGKLQIQNGRPEYYKNFLTNVIVSNLTDVIIPLPLPSLQAASYIKEKNLKAQFIYIDGCHEEEAVIADLRAYWTLLESKGQLLIDDYNYEEFMGVVTAIGRFSNEIMTPYRIWGQKALFVKA